MPKLHIVLKDEDLGEFDPDEVDMEQAMQLQDQTGFTIGELMPALGKLDARAMQALVFLQRICLGQHPATWHAKFKFGDLKVEEVSEVDPTPAADPVAELEKTFAKSGTSTSGS